MRGLSQLESTLCRKRKPFLVCKDNSICYVNRSDLCDWKPDSRSGCASDINLADGQRAIPKSIAARLTLRQLNVFPFVHCKLELLKVFF